MIVRLNVYSILFGEDIGAVTLTGENNTPYYTQ